MARSRGTVSRPRRRAARTPAGPGLRVGGPAGRASLRPTATLLVFDSSGASTRSSVTVTVQPDPAGGSSAPSRPTAWFLTTVGSWELVGIVLLVGLAIVGLLVTRKGQAWRRTVFPPLSATGLAGRALGELDRGSAGTDDTASGPAVEPLGPASPPDGGVGARASPSAIEARAPSVESVRLSRRILLRLADLGPPGAEGTVSEEYSQRGLADALGARQGALSNVLRRLVAAGVVIEERRHVQNAPRRLKVYRLTAEGRAVARDARAAPVSSRTDARGRT
jgi:DNA-binding MarR family transcriptional regulator